MCFSNRTCTICNWTWKIPRSYFHLWSCGWNIWIFPWVPNYSLSTDSAIKIQTIKVWLVAVFVPPGPLILYSTVCWIEVIIMVLGSKRLVAMIRKRITSGAWEKKKNKKYRRIFIHHMRAQWIHRRHNIIELFSVLSYYRATILQISGNWIQ